MSNDVGETIAFFIGCIFGVMLTLIITLGAIGLDDPSLIVRDNKLVHKNVYYNVTIDTAKTDSLFGKTWRK